MFALMIISCISIGKSVAMDWKCASFLSIPRLLFESLLPLASYFWLLFKLPMESR